MGKEVLTLSKPTMINGKEITELEYNLEDLSGDDIFEATKTLAKNNLGVGMQETDAQLHAALFAIAAGIDYLDVRRFSAKDFLTVGRVVRNFLFLD